MEQSSLIDKKEVKTRYGQFLTFLIGNDVYGIHVDDVREALEYNQAIQLTRIPLIHKSILGVMNLRGEVIPVIDLSMRLYNREIDAEQRRCIVIIDITDSDKNITVGALVNTVNGVVNIFDEEIMEVPDFGLKIPSCFISKIGKIEDKLTVLLNTTEMLNIDELSELTRIDDDTKNFLSMKTLSDDDFNFARASGEEDLPSEEIVVEYNFIIFKIANESYAINIVHLFEVINIANMTYIPNTLPFMKGVINLRGRVVPVIDMRERCNLEPVKYHKNTPVLIARFDDILIGLIVDSVQRTLKYPIDKVQSPPHYSAKIDSDFISGLIQINDKIVILLNVYKILSMEELDLLKNKDLNKEEQ